MEFDWRLLLALMLLALVPGAFCLEIGGGGSAMAGPDSTVQGSFLAGSYGGSSTLMASGSVPHAGEVRFVQDDTGKRAEVSF